MITRYTLALVSVCLLPAAAFAQADRGAIVGGSVSAVNMESHTDFAFAGTFGYRFSRVFGMEIEATVVPSLKTPFPGFPVILGSSVTVTGGALPFTQIYPGPSYGNAGGRLVIFTNNARVEIPSTSTRVTPYFVAGGGIASVRRTADFTYPIPFASYTSPSGVVSQLRPIITPVISSSTDLALTIGGGVDIRVVKQLAVEADLRLFRLLGGQDDRNVGRFGVGVRYRF
jgi:opacity protein-like surface antigen